MSGTSFDLTEVLRVAAQSAGIAALLGLCVGALSSAVTEFGRTSSVSNLRGKLPPAVANSPILYDAFMVLAGARHADVNRLMRVARKCADLQHCYAMLQEADPATVKRGISVTATHIASSIKFKFFDFFSASFIALKQEAEEWGHDCIPVSSDLAMAHKLIMQLVQALVLDIRMLEKDKVEEFITARTAKGSVR